MANVGHGFGGRVLCLGVKDVFFEFVLVLGRAGIKNALETDVLGFHKLSLAGGVGRILVAGDEILFLHQLNLRCGVDQVGDIGGTQISITLRQVLGQFFGVV